MRGIHVVLGASGGAGNAIVRELHRAGIPVRAVNRSGRTDVPDGVERIAADLTVGAQARRSVEGAEVVYMAAQPAYHRWPQEFPPLLAEVVAATAEVGAKLVMVDNLYTYGPGSGTISEQTPERATDRKGRVRKEMAEMLRDAHRSGRLRVAIGRASDYYGPRADNSGLTALAIAPAARGRTARWIAALDVPHSIAYLPDVARAYVRLGTSEAADGHTWILPHGEPVTGRRFLAAVAAAAGGGVDVRVLSKGALRVAAPFHRPSREILGVLYQWSAPFVVDDRRFRATFGDIEVTPLGDAVATAVAAYRSRSG